MEVPECSDRQFIVLNTLENPKLPTNSPKEKAQYAVLFIVLAHIFMSGGVSDQGKQITKMIITINLIIKQMLFTILVES